MRAEFYNIYTVSHIKTRKKVCKNHKMELEFTDQCENKMRQITSKPSLFATYTHANEENYNDARYTKKIILKCFVRNVHSLQLNEELRSQSFYLRNLPLYISVKRVDKIHRNKRHRNHKTDSLIIGINVNVEDKRHWACDLVINTTVYKNGDALIGASEQGRISQSVKTSSPFVAQDFEYQGLADCDEFNFIFDIQADMPTAIEWPSRAATSYTGLQNEGATCYINSLLQSLFLTNEFRRIVYNIPVNTNEVHYSFEFILQYLFYRMQFDSYDNFGTKKLIERFNWSQMTSAAQQDVQEFLRRLIEKLESCVKGTPLENRLMLMLLGNIKTRIRCINVDFKSENEQHFFDLQLTVDNNRTIYHAFEAYMKEEHLNGENRYDTGAAKEDAIKSIEFTRLPPVLYLHLMRFNFDPNNNSICKNNNRFEFYADLDLSNFIPAMDPNSVYYTLHSVLVHSGNANTGHYIVYINPKANGEWYKFNDRIVTKCSSYEAIDQNYGESSDSAWNSNAYMLVYIKNSEIPNILGEISLNDIVNEAMIQKEIKNDLREFYEVFVFTPETMQAHQYERNDDLFNTKHTASHIKFLIDRTNKLKDLFALIAKAFCLRQVEKKCKLWKINSRKNGLMLPRVCEQEMNEKLANLFRKDYAYFFLELSPLGETFLHEQGFDNTTHALVFIKSFDGANEKFTFFGHKYFFLDQTIDDVQKYIKQSIHFAGDLSIYANNNSTLTKITKIDKKIHRYALKDTETYVAIFAFKLFNTGDVMLNFHGMASEQNQILVTFKNKSEPLVEDLTIMFDRELMLRDLLIEFSQLLNEDVAKIQFFDSEQTAVEAHKMNLPISYVNSEVQPRITRRRILNNSSIVFYYHCQKQIQKNKHKLHLLWVSMNGLIEKQIECSVDNSDTVGDIFQKTLSNGSVEPMSPESSLRFLKLNGALIESVVPVNTCVSELVLTNHCYRIEEAPSNQLDENINDSTFLVCVHFYGTSPSERLQTSILLEAYDNEPFRLFALRLANNIGVSDNEWLNQWKFRINGESTITNVVQIDTKEKIERRSTPFPIVDVDMKYELREVQMDTTVGDGTLETINNIVEMD